MNVTVGPTTHRLAALTLILGAIFADDQVGTFGQQQYEEFLGHRCMKDITVDV